MDLAARLRSVRSLLLRPGDVALLHRIKRADLTRWPNLVRIAAVMFVLSAIRSPRVRVVLDPPKRVTTVNPIVGVHTRLTDEVEEWKIQRTLQLVREMGAPWIVEYFPWPYIEPARGSYSWRHADTVIQHAENQGLRVIARLGWVPEWARLAADGEVTTLTTLPSARYADFAEFVALFVDRYRGRVSHIIVWNEPNLSFEWGYRPVDPEGYATLLREVYPRAHAANPDVSVLAGALAPTLEPEGSAAGLNDLVYLARMLKVGAGLHFDALSAHAYGMKAPPEEPPAPEVINFRRVELLREVMVRYDVGDKPIYVTEAGWNDHPRWIHAVRPAERIRYTVGAYEWARRHWPWCPSVAIWAFRYPSSTHNYQDNYAFVMGDFQPKVIYLEVEEYTHSTRDGAP